MTAKKDRPELPVFAQSLRERAEQRSYEKSPQLVKDQKKPTPGQGPELLHELHVHQIELEIQNEELLRNQAQLEVSRASYWDLYDQAPVGYLTLDKNGIILTSNSKALKMFAAESRPFVGQPLTRFILPDDQDIYYLHRRQREKGDAWECELRMLRAGAASFWTRLDSTTGLQPDGELLRRITIIDISERKQMEAERQFLTAQLAEKRNETEDFMRLAAHDLRTPLACIQGFINVFIKDLGRLTDLLTQAPLPEKTRDAIFNFTGSVMPDSLGALTESMLKMNQLVDALTKTPRQRGGKMHPGQLNAKAVLKSVLDTLRCQMETAGAKVKTGKFPPCKADPAAFSHILTNLLDNALKYRDKSRKLKITVSGNKKDGIVLYSITDNGSGLTKTALQKIWEISGNGNAQEVKKGEGIGLPTVRRIAAQNFGRIWAKSKKGKGSTFFIEMPAS